MPWETLIQAVTPDTSAQASLVTTYLNFGALGGFALVSLWFYLTVYRQSVARGDRAEAALAELNKEIRDKVIPALVDSTRAVDDVSRQQRDRR